MYPSHKFMSAKDTKVNGKLQAPVPFTHLWSALVTVVMYESRSSSEEDSKPKAVGVFNTSQEAWKAVKSYTDFYQKHYSVVRTEPHVYAVEI